MILRCLLALFAGLLSLGPVFAQTSTSYRLEEHVLNAGGHPAAGEMLVSTSYRVTLDAIGDGTAGWLLTGPSYSMESGLVLAHPPPGEVIHLEFIDSETLVWDPERSVGVYHLYRDSLAALSGLGYGQCEQSNLTDETVTDTDTPPEATGYFYLVTAENTLNEEGTKGWDASGAERANPAPCA